MNIIVLFVIQVLCGQCSQSVLVYNVPNMHAMSYRYDFFAYSCRVTILEPAVCVAVSLLSAVPRAESPSF
jgi:hypothetical protein